MRNAAILTGLLTLSCLVLPSQATSQTSLIPDVASASQGARDFQRLRVPGREVSRAVRSLVADLNWKKTLGAAQRAAKKTGKPIVWIQALGSLTGYT